MFIRCAFFEGKVKPGYDRAFADFVKERLLPLWTQFPGAEEVRVMRQFESDTESPHYAMVLAIKYPSREAIELAMASDVRAQSRAETGELIEMFEGRIFHTVFDAAHNVVIV